VLYRVLIDQPNNKPDDNISTLSFTLTVLPCDFVDFVGLLGFVGLGLAFEGSCPELVDSCRPLARWLCIGGLRSLEDFVDSY